MNNIFFKIRLHRSQNEKALSRTTVPNERHTWKWSMLFLRWITQQAFGQDATFSNLLRQVRNSVIKWMTRRLNTYRGDGYPSNGTKTDRKTFGKNHIPCSLCRNKLYSVNVLCVCVRLFLRNGLIIQPGLMCNLLYRWRWVWTTEIHLPLPGLKAHSTATWLRFHFWARDLFSHLELWLARASILSSCLSVNGLIAFSISPESLVGLLTQETSSLTTGKAKPSFYLYFIWNFPYFFFFKKKNPGHYF